MGAIDGAAGHGEQLGEFGGGEAAGAVQLEQVGFPGRAAAQGSEASSAIVVHPPHWVHITGPPPSSATLGSHTWSQLSQTRTTPGPGAARGQREPLASRGLFMTVSGEG